MIKLTQRSNTVLFATVLGLAAPAALANHLYTAVNMMSCELLLIDIDRDILIKHPLAGLPGMPQAVCQHTWVTPDEKTIYISTNTNETYGASIVTLKVDGIDFDAGRADIRLTHVLEVDKPGTQPNFPVVTQTSETQPIPPWWFPTVSQVHAPTMLPGTKFSFTTGWTDNRIRSFKTNAQGLTTPVQMNSFGSRSAQKHGVNFNLAGTLGISAGYHLDQGTIEVFVPNKSTGAVSWKRSIPLGTKKSYAAFSHYTTWIDNRYAVVGTMQFGPTSLTPTDGSVIGPSIWLIDARNGTSKMIVGTASSVDAPGIYRSASSVSIAHDKMYVAEEDSMDSVFGQEGYISIFDIADINHPVFIKRMRPGRELPHDFVNGHTSLSTTDETAVMVSSFVSNHIVKIDPVTDEVVKVWDMQDGLDMPHGEFISGRYQ